MLDTLPLSRKQIRSVAESTTKISCWEGAIRSGKTIASLLKWLIFIANAPTTGELVMIGKTSQTIHRNLFLPMQDVSLFGDIAKQVHYTPGAPTAVILGRIVHIIGANDAKSEPKIRGMTVCGAYVDEVTLVPQIFFEQLYGRMSVHGAQLFCTTNPDNPMHWFMRDWLSHAGKKPVSRFSFTIDDNPFLDPDYVADMKASHEGLFYRRFILGDWVAAEGAIYDSWDRERHIVKALPPEGIYKWISLGVDYGTSNPFHAVLIGLGRDRRLYAAAEWRYESRQTKKQLTDTEYSQRLRSWLSEVPGVGAVRPQFVTVDPSAASFVTQLKRDRLTPTPAKNDVMDGIRTVSSLLATNQLLVHESCKGLITEIGGYSWDDKAALRGEEKPIKVADHGCLVAGTPVATMRGEVPIESVRPGDLALTRQGFKPIVAAGMTSPAAQVFRVEIDGGLSLEGTGNHPVWVQGKGWIRLDELRYADTILTWRTVASQSSSVGSLFGDTQRRRGGQSAPISPPASRTERMESAASMRKYGWLTTPDRYLPAITSITSMATHSTIAPRTWLASLRQNMPPITSPNGEACAARRREPTWSASDLWLRRGIGPLKGEPGTPRTAVESGRGGTLTPSPASSAAPPARRARPTAASGFAVTPASQLGDEQPESTTSKGTASGAAHPSPPTSTAGLAFAEARVLGVTRLSDAVPVWNLTIADCPEYFAGGVLVHNCDALRYGIFTTRTLWRHKLTQAA